MDIIPLTGGLGAEIIGVDPSRGADLADIKQAFSTHSVVVLRGQSMTPEAHLTFARSFGPINVNRFFKPLEGYPEIATVIKEADQKNAVGEGWHTDHSYDVEPALGSILRAVEMPAVGGDTVFASMGMAYEALSPTMQDFVEGLYAWHSSRHVFGASAQDSETARSGRVGNAEVAKQDSRHPVVIRHPLSGRKTLYVNPVFTTAIDGVSAAESDALLAFLYQHCQQPEFQCRVRYRAGDVAIWDNRATWHKAINDYHGHRREMHRITVEGCALRAARG